jgi:cell fate regulator YaaT (PSP1 superfamily)
VLRQVRAALQPILEEHIQSAKQKIADTVKAQQTSHIAALQQLQAKLAEGQTAFAAARAQYQADRDNVTQLITSLESAQ